MWCFLANADWVQALATVALVVLTGVTLFVLWGYAKETKRIANASVLQIENSQMPFLALVHQSVTTAQVQEMQKTNIIPKAFIPPEWIVQNQGNGPAINVTTTHCFDEGIAGRSSQKNAMAKGDWFEVGGINVDLKRQQRFTIEYESLSRNKYRTEVTWADQKMETRFYPPQTAFKEPGKEGPRSLAG